MTPKVQALLQSTLPTFSGNVLWGTSTVQEGVSYPSSGQAIVVSCCGSDITPHPLYVPGSNSYVDPAFANTTDLLANRVGAPTCASPDTVTCMATVIADLVPSAGAASGKGYRTPGPCAANADYPAWLKGVVYLHWTGTAITQNKGLVYGQPCGT